MQTLPRQDEHRPRLYLGKDEVECGITAAMTRGGPAVRTREMGKYFQAVLYEFYVRVARTISHSFASLTREISFLPREHKIHIFEPTCNILYL